MAPLKVKDLMNNPNYPPANPNNRIWNKPCILHINGFNLRCVSDLYNQNIFHGVGTSWWVTVWTSDLILLPVDYLKHPLNGNYAYQNSPEVTTIKVPGRDLYVVGEEPEVVSVPMLKIKYC